MTLGDRVVILRGPLNGMYGTLVDTTKDGGHPIVRLDDGIDMEFQNWHMIELASEVPAVRRVK